MRHKSHGLRAEPGKLLAHKARRGDPIQTNPVIFSLYFMFDELCKKSYQITVVNVQLSLCSTQPQNNQTCPHLSSKDLNSKQTNEHRFGNELEAKYWLGLKFWFPPEGLCLLGRWRTTLCQSSMVASQALPFHYYTIFSPALLCYPLIKALLCSGCSLAGKAVTTTRAVRGGGAGG